jgi:hypothetical protein
MIGISLFFLFIMQRKAATAITPTSLAALACPTKLPEFRTMGEVG